VDLSIKCLIVQKISGRTVHLTLVVRLGIKVLGLEFWPHNNDNDVVNDQSRKVHPFFFISPRKVHID
jgi:hypothetical protein